MCYPKQRKGNWEAKNLLGNNSQAGLFFATQSNNKKVRLKIFLEINSSIITLRIPQPKSLRGVTQAREAEGK